MDSHAIRLLGSIEAACQQYVSGGIALPELQQRVEAIVSSLEKGESATVGTRLEEFTSRLEYFRFMLASDEQRIEVENEIKSVVQYMRHYLQS